MTKLTKVSRGWYETTYKGHKIELVDLQELHGAPAREWIAPIDGSNDITPAPTRREALETAMTCIDQTSRTY